MGPFVTASWLSDHLNDPTVAVLDATLPPVGVVPRVDTHSHYLERHIPGARFFDIDKLSDASSPLPHTLPTADQFARDMSLLGVGDAMTIVVYEQHGVFSAPRARWMLKTFGAKHVFLLDGDLESWVTAAYKTEQGSVTSAPAVFHAKLNPAAVRDFADIQSLIAAHAQILDARSAGRFSGAAPEPRPGLSSGHMPGAINIPFTDLAENGKMLPPDRLRELFVLRGVDLDQPAVTTCGSGVTAAVVALGLELAGATDVGLYDGSWAEYGQHTEAVIEKSA